MAIHFLYVIIMTFLFKLGKVDGWLNLFSLLRVSKCLSRGYRKENIKYINFLLRSENVSQMAFKSPSLWLCPRILFSYASFWDSRCIHKMIQCIFWGQNNKKARFPFSHSLYSFYVCCSFDTAKNHPSCGFIAYH